MNLENLGYLSLLTWNLLSALLCATSYLNFLVFVLCLIYYVSYLVSCFCYLVHYISSFISHLHVSYVLRFFAYLWLYVLCVTSPALFLAQCLMHYISRFVFYSLGFCSYSSVVDLLVFALYIVRLNQQSYVELVTN